MIKTGLVSISFRKFSPKEIVDMVKQAGLDGIEWGGDVHVPHGDVEVALKVKKLTENAGLQTAAYGSYYRVGCEKEYNVTFDRVLKSAVVLQTPVIRVWAGNIPSEKANDAYRQNMILESSRIAKMASEYGIDIAYEFHANTLTDTIQSAMDLLNRRMQTNILSYWQPPTGTNENEQQNMLDGIRPYLSNIHVYNWMDKERRPLEEAIPRWVRLMEKINSVKGDRYAMIEFVKDDSEEQFLSDAKALITILDKI